MGSLTHVNFLLGKLNNGIYRIPLSRLKEINVEILKSLVEKNAGISFLPEFTIKRQLEEQRLVKINIPEVFKVWRQLIYHKHKWVTASMKVMIDLIRDYEYDKKNFSQNKSL